MFDVDQFRKAKFSVREDEITLGDLAKAGFGDGVFKVRGLTAEELARAEESINRNKMLAGLVERLAGNGKEQVEALLEGVGIRDGVPASLTKRIEHVRLGVVEPELTQQDVVLLGETFPIELGQLANKILELTGQGQVAQVKRKPSGKGRTSNQP